MNEPSQPPPNSRFAVIQFIDGCIVAIIKGLIMLAHARSRDPSRGWGRLLKADQDEKRRIRQWEQILNWPQHQRVGWVTAVLSGLIIGAIILWYGLRN